MATNRHDTLDPALLRPGRLDRKIEFPMPDRRQKRLIFSTITAKMNLSEEVDLEDCILSIFDRIQQSLFFLVNFHVHVQLTPLFWTWLIPSRRYFEGRSNSLGFTLMFSVIYCQLFWTRLFQIPCYFELIVCSLHLKSTPVFRTCQKQITYIRAQLETYCILFELVLRNHWLNNTWLTCSVPLRNSSCVIQLQKKMQC